MKLAPLAILSFAAHICFGQNEFTVRISIPIGSGIAAVPYRIFEIKQHNFYVIDKGYPWDTLAKDRVLKEFTINDSIVAELKKIIDETDSIGDHSGFCDINFGWPRFFISFNDNGRKSGGFITNVYRKHVYRIVDAFNKIAPEGDIIRYNKEDLLKQEEECERRFFRKN